MESLLVGSFPHASSVTTGGSLLPNKHGANKKIYYARSYAPKASQQKTKVQNKYNLQFGEPSLNNHYKCIEGDSPNKKCNRKYIVKASSEPNACDPKTVLHSVKNFLVAFIAFSRPYTMVGIVSSTIASSLLTVEKLSDISPLFFTNVLKALVLNLTMSIYVNGVNQLFDVEIDKLHLTTLQPHDIISTCYFSQSPRHLLPPPSLPSPPPPPPPLPPSLLRRCLSCFGLLPARLLPCSHYQPSIVPQSSPQAIFLFLIRNMPEKKPVVGLTWQPTLPVSSSLKATDGSHIKTQIGASRSTVWKPTSELVDGLFAPPNDPRKLNKLLRKQVKDTAGKNWFNMPAQTITLELQKDLKLLKLRGAIDPKRHHKKGDSKSKTLPKYFQMGTVVDSPLDFFSGRLTKKERRASLADELLADQNLVAYR